jgi:hypothetical protein
VRSIIPAVTFSKYNLSNVFLLPTKLICAAFRKQSSVNDQMRIIYLILTIMYFQGLAWVVLRECINGRADGIDQ